MPSPTWNAEWLNSNSLRSYPLAVDATKQDISGSFNLPDSFLVGLYFPVTASLDIQVERIFLRSIAVLTDGYSVSLGYDDDGTVTTIASVSVPRSTHTPYAAYALHGRDAYADSVGKIVIGYTEDIDRLGAGQYTFDLEGGSLDPDCIRPLITGVSAIRVRNGSDLSERLQGVVELVAGANIRLTVLSVFGQAPQIRIDAITGEGLVENCVCDGVELGDPIRTINGQAPGLNGNFTIVGNQCIDIETITNGLRFRDTCSTPCVGCTELSAVVADLSKFGDGARTLEQTIARMERETVQMRTVFLSTRLSNPTCLE